MEKEIEALRKVPLFADFPDPALKKFSETFKRSSYEAGGIIFREGSEGDTLFILVSGRVVIEKKLDRDGGSFKPLAVLSAGEFFGEMSVLEKQVRFAQARAEEASSLYEIGREEFFSFIRNNPENGIAIFTEIVRVIARRLQHTSSELTMLFDMSRLIMRDHRSAADFIRRTVEEVSIYFDGAWNFRGYVYDPFNDEFERVVSKEAFADGGGDGVGWTPGADSGWTGTSSYRMVCRAHGKPAGYVVFSKASPVSEQERNSLTTIFDTVSCIMGSAIENIEHRTEAAMLEKLKTQKSSI